MNEKKIKIDPHLLTYIYKSLHRYPDNLYDITKIKQLDCDGYIAPYDFYYENVPIIIEICEGAWEIIGEMKNLKRLFIRNIELPDFSFLEKCVRLEKLVLTQTNFSDCMPLRKLINLKNLTLEYIDKLANTEILSDLNCHIEDEANKLLIPMTVIGAELEIDEYWKDTHDIFAEYLDYMYIQPSGENIESDSQDNSVYHTVYTTNEEQPVTEQALDWLYSCIQQGNLIKLVAMKKKENNLEYGLTASCKEGWISIIIEEIITEDEYEDDEFDFEDEDFEDFEPQPVFFYYHNLSCPDSCEESPAYMEEGMSVPKALSCNNLYEAAEIILYFIKTGKLYPKAEWYGYLDWI